MSMVGGGSRIKEVIIITTCKKSRNDFKYKTRGRNLRGGNPVLLKYALCLSYRRSKQRYVCW